MRFTPGPRLSGCLTPTGCISANFSGRDFAKGDGIAAQMRNFAYLIGDRQTGDCVVVDPAYAAGDLLDALEADGMHLSGVLVTHTIPTMSAAR